MTTDKTYTPIENGFNELVTKVFPTGGISNEQRETLRHFYFAGAATTVGLIKCDPDNLQTVFDELVDHTYRFEVA